VVHFNGKPLEGALVTFLNPTANLTASANTDADGHFQMTTFVSGDGVAPGKQQVAVTKVEAPAMDPAALANSPPPVWGPAMEKAGKHVAGTPPPRWLIPKRYSSVQTSKLTAEVPESGTNDIVLELQAH
jgi:hypothetical protein